jgi:hypothetical protein
LGVPLPLPNRESAGSNPGYNPLETICSIKIKTNIEKEGRGGERES